MLLKPYEFYRKYVLNVCFDNLFRPLAILEWPCAFFSRIILPLHATPTQSAPEHRGGKTAQFPLLRHEKSPFLGIAGDIRLPIEARFSAFICSSSAQSDAQTITSYLCRKLSINQNPRNPGGYSIAELTAGGYLGIDFCCRI